MRKVRTAARVISLEAAVERRRTFEENVRGAAFEWQFFPAHCKEQAPLTYDNSVTVRRIGRPLSSGERGAYSSHYRVWEAFLESDLDQIIVLEDDVIVDCLLLNRLVAYDFTQNRIDIMRMFATHPFTLEVAIPRFCSPHYHLVRCKGRVFGIQAYLLTRKGAQALLETGTTIAEPVDWVMARYWSYKIPNYCLFPFPIVERHVPSTISGSREDRYDTSLTDRAHRFYWRVKNRAVREFADRIQFRKSPFGERFDAGPSYMDTVPQQKAS